MVIIIIICTRLAHLPEHWLVVANNRLKNGLLEENVRNSILLEKHKRNRVPLDERTVQKCYRLNESRRKNVPLKERMQKSPVVGKTGEDRIIVGKKQA